MRKDRVRTSNYHVRRGPSLGFVAQMLAQDAQADRGRQVTPAEGAATYPSLVSDLDIFLPGEEIVLADVPAASRFASEQHSFLFFETCLPLRESPPFAY